MSLAGMLAASLAFAGPVLAQADKYPSRTVHLIVPFAAGGPTDIGARIVAEQLSKAWGQPVVVEPRPGGGSVIGSTAVSQAAPDGYTLLFGPSSALIENKFLLASLPYDPLKSFAPVMEVYQIGAALTVNAKVQAKTLKELIALSRSKPLTYASFGIGTGPHLLMESFKKAAGVDITHVPYKGAAPGLLAVVSGEVHMTGAGLGTVRPHMEAGKLRMLAVIGDKPSRFAPGVPTFDSEGFKDISGGSLFIGMWAPAGTPQAIVDKVNRDVVAALDSKEFTTFLERFAYTKGEALSPAALTKLMVSELEKWEPFIKTLGIKR